ncbi:Major facilitator superfamily protein [Prunus dulcis]|uniref:Major facilitator superfamily protein n=1 Tax=Prunus dulcis TaxID=3755 RepID=A0A4Y1RKF8_PRUDU|nr:Major facilitator superfamily protein [Prunus dulcis]
MLTLQWLSLVGIIWLQSINGTNTNFPAYSSQLKNVLSMSQIQLNNLAFASDAGKLLGWFSGIAAIYLPLWLVLLIVPLHHKPNPSPSYWLIFFLTVLAGIASAGSTLSAMLSALGTSMSPADCCGDNNKLPRTECQDLHRYCWCCIFFLASEKAKAYLLLNALLPLGVGVVVAPLVRNINVMERPRNMKAGERRVYSYTMEENNNGIGSLEIGAVKEGEELDGRQVHEPCVREEIGVKLMCNTWVGVLEQLGTDSRVPLLIQDFISGLSILFFRVLWAPHAFSSRLFLLKEQVYDFKAGVDIGIGGSNRRGFLLASQPSKLLSFPRHSHYRSVHWSNNFNCSLHNNRAVWDQEFLCEPQCVVANISIGSFVFGYLSAIIYRKEGNQEDGRCMGMACYRSTFVIWGSLCFLGAGLALVLFARTRKFYSQKS